MVYRLFKKYYNDQADSLTYIQTPDKHAYMDTDEWSDIKINR